MLSATAVPDRFSWRKPNKVEFVYDKIDGAAMTVGSKVPDVELTFPAASVAVAITITLTHSRRVGWIIMNVKED